MHLFLQRHGVLRTVEVPNIILRCPNAKVVLKPVYELVGY